MTKKAISLTYNETVSVKMKTNAYGVVHQRQIQEPDETYLEEVSVSGSYVQLHLQNGILNMPGEQHHQSSWHRDLPYQDFVISRPIAISALFCIDDFTVETGATYVLPYSHKQDILPSAGFVEKHQHAVNAPAGSVILFDSMLYHRAGFNSSDRIRRGINHVYCVPLLKQQIDLPRLLKGRYADNEFHKKLLGYESQVPDSDIQYRKNKHDRTSAKS